MTIEKILFYGIIVVGAALIIGLTYYRIDWARHPEKYQDLVDQAEKDEKEAAQRRAMRKLGKKKRRSTKSDRLQGRSLLYGQLLFSTWSSPNSRRPRSLR